MAAGFDGSDKIVVSTKMLRAELLSVKTDLGAGNWRDCPRLRGVRSEGSHGDDLGMSAGH
jgi:hypothetical protein